MTPAPRWRERQWTPGCRLGEAAGAARLPQTFATDSTGLCSGGRECVCASTKRRKHVSEPKGVPCVSEQSRREPWNVGPSCQRRFTAHLPMGPGAWTSPPGDRIEACGWRKNEAVGGYRGVSGRGEALTDRNAGQLRMLPSPASNANAACGEAPICSRDAARWE